MKEDLINGVKLKKLEFRIDYRGKLLEILRCDDEIYEEFGQVYITTAYPGVVKAWHAHTYQRDNITCIKGMIRLVLYDEREGSPSYGKINEFYIGEINPILVSIPPMVWHGFQNVGTEECIVINVPTKPYIHKNPDELRKPAHGVIPFSWEKLDK